ncbi:MAG: ABC transporter ATP-binding protein [Spirochaetaceae bacterium]|nr:ABC transporter ATP-binding protein [Spirochaetaceae bacterium]
MMEAMIEPMIEASGPDDMVIRDLEVRFTTPFGEAEALNRVDLTLAAGSVTGLIGESGSGKSVLGMSILRLLPANALVSGSIFFQGRDLLRSPPEDMRDLRGKVLGLIPQNPSDSIDPVLPIRPQIREIFQAHERISRKRGNEKARGIAGNFFTGEEDRVLGSFGFQLSGGMRQRVVTIFGLAGSPRWIIADEPTKGMDAILRGQVHRLLARIAESGRQGMLVITHDIPFARSLCSRIAVLYRGRIVEEGESNGLVRSPLHPYTRTLLASLPCSGPEALSVREAMPVPLAASSSGGCDFAEYCALRTDECLNTRVPLRTVSGGAAGERKVRCLRLPGEAAPEAPKPRAATLGDAGTARMGAAVSSERPPAVETAGLCKEYRAGTFSKKTRRVVEGVSLRIERGTTFGLVGDSGCGKSTLARLILRLIPANGGQVFFNGEDITAATGDRLKLLRRKMQIIFQHPESSLNPSMRIMANLLEPPAIQGIGDKQERMRRIHQNLELVGIDRRLLTRYPHEISGGEAQRIIIARALMVKAEFLVLDEPTSMLDVSVQAQILNLLKSLQERLGLTYLFISHDLDVVRWISRDIAFMHRGRIVEQGRAAEIFAHPRHEYTRRLIEGFRQNSLL